MSHLNTLADRVDQAIDNMINEVEKILMEKVLKLSRTCPKRVFSIVSGHGSLSLLVTRRSQGYNLMTGHADYFSVDYSGDTSTAPKWFASDLFAEVDEISTRFQDHYNGYSCVQVDYKVQNGKLIDSAAA